MQLVDTDELKNNFKNDVLIINSINPNNMTIEEMILYSNEHPKIKISHPLFSDDEYIFTLGTEFYDERGLIFESFIPWDLFHNGLRMRRKEKEWQNNWYVKESVKNNI